jgi:hypothetical protein
MWPEVDVAVLKSRECCLGSDLYRSADEASRGPDLLEFVKECRTRAVSKVV